MAQLRAQRAVEALDLALRLRVADPSVVQANPLLDQLHRQPGQAPAILLRPPQRSSVHQQGLRHPVVSEGLHQTRPSLRASSVPAARTSPPRTGCDHPKSTADGTPARAADTSPCCPSATTRWGPNARTVSAPERGRPPAPARAAPRCGESCAPAPPRPASSRSTTCSFFAPQPVCLAQGRDAFFLPRFRARRTVLRTSTPLAQGGETPPALIAPSPQVARGPRYPKFPAQARHALLPAHRPNHKSHPLLVHVHPVPRHLSRPPPRGRVLYPKV